MSNDTNLGMRGFVGKRSTKKSPFMGAHVEISKLSISQVMEIQERSKEQAANPDAEHGFDLLKLIIRLSVTGSADISDEEFDGFPIEDLKTLSEEIMKYSGIAPGEAGK